MVAQVSYPNGFFISEEIGERVPVIFDDGKQTADRIAEGHYDAHLGSRVFGFGWPTDLQQALRARCSNLGLIWESLPRYRLDSLLHPGRKDAELRDPHFLSGSEA